MEDTLFSKIIRGEIPCEKIYEDEVAFAFLDIKPITKGHTLVVPKKAYPDMFAMPENELQALIPAVMSVARLVKEKFGAKGVNIGVNNGAEAGQEVFHLHFHVIPRYGNEPHLTHWPRMDCTFEDLAAVRKALTE